MSFISFTSVLRGLSYSITYDKIIQETKVLILIKKKKRRQIKKKEKLLYKQNLAKKKEI
jgi:hypothetical protein